MSFSTRRAVPFQTALLLAPFVAIGALPGTAVGQGMEMSLDSGPKAVEVRAPAPADPGNPPFFLVYLAGFGLSAAAVGLAVMPSKRTHQD
jgi:hypothetical protein